MTSVLDGQKNWTVDRLAVFLIEKLLRPGGWLLMDDLGWTYSPNREGGPYSIDIGGLSEKERREPHLRAVFDLIVKQHPAFTRLGSRTNGSAGRASKLTSRAG